MASAIGIFATEMKNGAEAPFFIGEGKELLLFFDGSLGSVNNSSLGSINSSVSRGSGRSSGSVSRGSSRSGSSISRGGSRSSGRSGLFLNRSRSGNNRLFLLTASGQAEGDQSSNEEGLVHEISLSTRNKNSRYISGRLQPIRTKL